LRIIGIETSCDETGVAVFEEGRGIIVERLFSQAPVHAAYGGVVPELASRDHVRKLVPLVREALADASVDVDALDGVAYTAGPGLAGALVVGACFARAVAWGAQIPALGIHHMEGHLLAPMLLEDSPEMPFLALLVSGGHTLLVDVEGLGRYKILGESLDDAAGEAFDKVAKMLGLGYPGGPAIEKLALSGDSKRFHFPRPMTDRPGLDMSFSGLKTYVMNIIRDMPNDTNAKADVARAFSDAICDTFVIKCSRALQNTGRKRLVVAGGVSANTDLRARLRTLEQRYDVTVYFPPIRYATDNGAMIAYAGYRRLRVGEHDISEFKVRPRWPITELRAPVKVG